MLYSKSSDMIIKTMYNMNIAAPSTLDILHFKIAMDSTTAMSITKSKTIEQNSPSLFTFTDFPKLMALYVSQGRGRLKEE